MRTQVHGKQPRPLTQWRFVLRQIIINIFLCHEKPKGKQKIGGSFQAESPARAKNVKEISSKLEKEEHSNRLHGVEASQNRPNKRLG